MSKIATLPGVTSETIATSRIRTRVLSSGPKDGTPVVFLHGNIASATWWEEVMLSLPREFRAVAPDLRGFGEADPEKKIDATRGMGDFVDDLLALLAKLDIPKAHFVGNSMGGSILWSFLAAHPERVLSLTQVAPGSPYGFGGTKDAAGTPCYPDFAGSGGGLSNPELIQRLAAKDRSQESPFSMRNVLRAMVFRPPFIPSREEDLLSASLDSQTGEQALPGDFAPSPNWPCVAPGAWGAANALSPKYALDPRKLYEISNKPRILWIRGDSDVVVSNMAAADPGTLGGMGILPGWPGKEVYPPQPMVDQTRAVLDEYRKHGGWTREVVITEAAHSPFIEKLPQFNETFHQLLNEKK